MAFLPPSNVPDADPWSSPTAPATGSPPPGAGSSAPGTGRVLVLEDDPLLRRSYAQRLRTEGHVVDEVATLAEARAALDGAGYDCLVLDRLVPDGDALDLVIALKDVPGHPPVLVLSALGTVDQRVRGLDLGIDDYLSKPASLKELALRVGILVDRGSRSDWGPVHLGQVVVDRERGVVAVDGEEVHLTPHQHSVLDYLVAHRDRMITTEELLEHCWDRRRSLFADPLHSQITRLRSCFAGRLRIESVRGAGYLLEVQGDEVPAEGQGEGRMAPSR